MLWPDESLKLQAHYPGLYISIKLMAVCCVLCVIEFSSTVVIIEVSMGSGNVHVCY